MDKRTLFLFCALGTIPFVAGCRTQNTSGSSNTSAVDLQPIADYLSAQGYNAYSIPRADWGPGYVFLADMSSPQGSAPLLSPKQDEICSSLYAPALIKDVGLSLPNKKLQDTKSLDISLDLLKGLIGERNSAKASLTAKHVKDVTISWGPATESKIIREDIVGTPGQPISVQSKCFDAIQEQRRLRAFNKLWVITKAVSVDKLDYTFNTDSNAELGADVDLGKLLTLKPGIKWMRVNDRTLEISERRFVGYTDPRQLAAWAPKGAVSAETRSVDVRLGPVPPSGPVVIQ